MKKKPKKTGYFIKLMTLLTPGERRKLGVLFLGILMMGVLEIIGIGSIMPFMSVASDPAMIYTNEYLYWAYTFFGFESQVQFLLALGFLVVILIIISNTSHALVTYMIHRYSHMRQHNMSIRLLRSYLQRPYVFFLNQNSADLSKNILAEVSNLVLHVLLPALKMGSRIIITGCIIGFLIVIDPFLAVMVALILGGAYGGIYLTLRKKIGYFGRRRLEANKERYITVGEAIGGIKDVKILGKEESFISRYAKPSKRYAKAAAYNKMMKEIPRHALEALAFGGILLIVLYLISSRGNFQQTIPLISVYAFAGYRLMPALQDIFKGVAGLKSHLPVIDVLYEQLHDMLYNDDKTGISKAVSQSLPKLPFKRDLVLQGIEFTYPNTAEPVIKSQSMTISAAVLIL